MKIDNVTDGKIKLGSTTYTMQEAKYNGSVVWSRTSTVRYVITSATLYYGTDPERTSITAQAGNNSYAYITGDVDVYENNVYVRTLTNVTLIPVVDSEDFYVANTYYIRAYDLGTTPTSARKSAAVTATYNGATRSVGYVYQERNIKTATSIGEKQYDSSRSRTEEGNEGYYLNFSASPYSGSSNPIPAGGGSTTLSCQAGHTHYVRTYTPYVQYATFTYTSGATSQGIYDSGEDMTGSSTTSVSDNPTITGSATGFTRNGNTVTATDRAKVTGPARSVTYTATVTKSDNTTLTKTVTVYQQQNVAETTYTYNLSVDIDVVGTIPSSGGVYSVDYIAKRIQQDVYTSGAVDVHSEEGISAEVSGSNCTPDTQFVYGAGTFSIEVDPNLSTVFTRNIGVTISEFGESASDTVTQDAYVEPTVNTASVSANLDFRTNKVVLRLVMTSGTFPGEVVIEGLVYHYIPTGSYERTIPILDEVTIDDPRIGVTLNEIPAFSSGASGEHWFSATSVSEIGLANTTFPHTEFEVISD